MNLSIRQFFGNKCRFKEWNLIVTMKDVATLKVTVLEEVKKKFKRK
jgi:hypothetical protein